jgi:hypothetical protein
VLRPVGIAYRFCLLVATTMAARRKEPFKLTPNEDGYDVSEVFFHFCCGSRLICSTPELTVLLLSCALFCPDFCSQAQRGTRPQDTYIRTEGLDDRPRLGVVATAKQPRKGHLYVFFPTTEGGHLAVRKGK